MVPFVEYMYCICTASTFQPLFCILHPKESFKKLELHGNETKDLSTVHVARKPEETINKGACYMYVNQKHRDKPLLFHDKCSGFW